MSAPEIRSERDGQVLSVRVQPRAKREGIVGMHGTAIKVAVRQPPEKGRANDAVLDCLAEALRLPRAAFSIESGETSQNKRVLIAGIERGELEERLRPWASGH